MEPGEFHWTAGWYFKRVEDGAVRIRHGDLVVAIPAAEWASIVAWVSKPGDTAANYSAVLALHGESQ